MTNPRIAGAALHTILRTADRNEIKIPTETRTAIESTLESNQKVGAITFPRGDLAAMVVAAVDAGRDPLADPDIREAATVHAIAATITAGALVAAADERTVHVAQEHAAKLLKAFKPRYAELGQSLATDQATLKAVGITSLADVGHSVHASPDAGAAGSRCVVTIRTIHAINNALSFLQELSRYRGTPVDKIVTYADTGDTPAGEITRAVNRREHDPWGIVNNGWTLDLATPDEAQARYDRAFQLQAEADWAEENQRQRLVRLAARP